MKSHPSSLTVLQLIKRIESGEYQIPQFQRGFVWKTGHAADLIDSILKGYPIGTLILWQTKERFQSERTIGDSTFPPPHPGELVTYILDGQQRVTSLFATLKGHKVTQGKTATDFSQVFLDLTRADLSENEEWVVPSNHSRFALRDEGAFVAIRQVFSGKTTNQGKVSEKRREFLNDCRTKLHSYKVPIVLMTEASIEEATDIFARINTRGKPLSTFDVMVAKTFNVNPPFDLAERCTVLNATLEKALDFGGFSSGTILQAASAIIHGKEPSRKNIFYLSKITLRNRWGEIEEAMLRSARHFHKTLRAPHVGLLPYEALAVPFAYFYANQESPSPLQLSLLSDFFWRAALGARYESQSDTRIGQDLKRMDNILRGDKPDYKEYQEYFEPSDISHWGEFRLHDAYIKGLVCLLAYQGPCGFKYGVRVSMDKHSLLKSESKNYHHFFPLAYLRKRSSAGPLANHIANITILSAQENQKIGAKPPKIYLPEARETNSNLNATLRTHLITPNKSEIWVEDYNAFFEMRCRELSKAIKKQLVDS